MIGRHAPVPWPVPLDQFAAAAGAARAEWRAGAVEDERGFPPQ